MATFGKTTIGGTTGGWAGNQVGVCGPYASSAGTLTTISVYLNQNQAGSAAAIPVLYADSSGLPGALLAQGAEVTIPVQPAAWVDFPISYTLTAANYWIGLAVKLANSGFGSFYDALANGDKWVSNSYPTLPNPFGTPGGTNNQNKSIYATYSLAGPPGPGGGSNLPRTRTRLKVF